jgi:hypothetical protein
MTSRPNQFHRHSTFPNAACPKRDLGLLRFLRYCLWTLASACLVQCVMPRDARAIDILPRDYLPLQSGTNLTAFYYDFIQSKQFNFAGGATLKNNTDLQANVGVYRQIYYGDIDGRAWAAQLVVPFGSEQGQIAGNPIGNSGGLGDILVAAGISFLPRPQPYNIGFVLYVSAPTGSYSPTQPLNLGANRWSFDPQIGYTGAIGDKFWFDAAADMIIYTHNDNAGPLGATLSQQPTYQGQAWLSYIPDKFSLVSLGYDVKLGGAQSLDGTSTGVRTESQQIRLAYSHLLTGQFQLVGSIGHDVSVTGGFKRDVELLLRATYFFGPQAPGSAARPLIHK